jgi:hypothetical protein
MTWTQQQLERALGAPHRLEAAIGPGEQQRAFELAEHGGGGRVGVLRVDTEAFQVAADFTFPFLERVAGGDSRRR